MKITNPNQPARVQVFYTPAEKVVSIVTRTVNNVESQNINLCALLSLREVLGLLWAKITGRNKGEIFTSGKVIKANGR